MTPLASVPLAVVLRAAEEDGTAGPVSLFVILLIGVVTVLLIRNMDKRIKRLPRDFPPPPEPPADRDPRDRD